jgi:hypothetical protein
MLKIKKGLANILENNNEPGEEAPQPTLRAYARPSNSTSRRRLSRLSPSERRAGCPAASASAPRQVGDQIGWEEHLIQALAKAPDDVAQKLATCIDREVLLKVLQHREDPYLKVALLLLKK